MGKGKKRNNKNSTTTLHSDNEDDRASMVSGCTTNTARTNMSRKSGASSMMAKLAAEIEEFDLEDIESQIHYGIEMLGNGNKNKNKQGLDVLLFCLRNNYSVDTVRKNWQTITSACYRILKGQKDELCEKACYILGICCFYLDGDDGGAFYSELVDVLESFCREEQSHHKTVGKFDKWNFIEWLE